MFINAILMAVIIICLLVIFFIIVKKISSLKLMDLNTLAEEKEHQAKRNIIEQRLLRKIGSVRQGVSSTMRPIISKSGAAIKNFYDKVLELEKQYQKPDETIDPRSTAEKLEELKKQALEFQKLEQYEKAEEKIIEMIEIDNKNIEAYESLGDLYVASKDYGKAEETFDYIIKLLRNKQAKSGNSKIADCSHPLACGYEKLGYIQQLMDEPRQALGYYKKALSFEPNNPRFLDFLLKISIILKDKNLARKTLATLKKADPENQKIPEIEAQVEEL